MDYYRADNEGHIRARITMMDPLYVEEGKAFMQGIFLPFGITDDDDATGVRTGGFGSTDGKKE